MENYFWMKVRKIYFVQNLFHTRRWGPQKPQNRKIRTEKLEEHFKYKVNLLDDAELVFYN